MKKWARRVSAFMLFLAFCTLDGCRAASFVQYRLHPDRPPASASFVIPGLEDPVSVKFDHWGVPHIFGTVELDLITAMGFVHARDRLFQMEILRRVARGELSEIVGDRSAGFGYLPVETTLEMDRLNRTLGFKYYAERIVENMDPVSRGLIEAYCRGVNAYIEQVRPLPIEFKLLGIVPRPWTPEDSMSFGLYAYWGVSRNWTWELMRYALVEERGEEIAWLVAPRQQYPGAAIIPREMRDFRLMDATMPTPESRSFPEPPAHVGANALARLLGRIQAVEKALPIPLKTGASNNWVVAGSKTASGMPILANDPHLLHMLPSIFYEVHLSGDGYDAIGGSFPGTPAIFAGHNRHAAWGVTTTCVDSQDVYIEKVDPEDPDSYLFMGESRPFTIIEDPIRYLDDDGELRSMPFRLRMTGHGIVITDFLEELSGELPVMTLQWAYADAYKDLAAHRIMARAEGIEDFHRFIETIGAPNQNWVFVDDAGNIGYCAGGLVPLRAGWDGTFPVPGWTGEFEWQGFVPPAELPQVYNPGRGYIVTANNQVMPAGDYPYPFSYGFMPSYRADRIEELLAAKDDLEAGDMLAIQMDTVSGQARRFREIFAGACGEAGAASTEVRQARTILMDWDDAYEPDRVGPTLFAETWRQAFRLTLSDEMRPELYDFLEFGTHYWGSFDILLDDEDSILFDDRNTEEVEGRDTILCRALEAAVSSLSDRLGPDMDTWRWGRLHTLTYHHPLGSVGALKSFNYGPIEHGGSRGTVLMGGYTGIDGSYEDMAGPVFKQIIDMAHIDRAMMVIDSGQSGRPLTDHYHDQADLWIDGKMVPMLMDEEQIEENLEGIWTLLPQ